MNTDRILLLLSEVLGTEAEALKAFSKNAPLQELGLNSIRFIQFIVAFEEAFGLEVRDSDLLFSNFQSLESLFCTLEKYFSKPIPAKKVLVCDCDNVLWQGVAGEEPLSLDDTVADLHQALIRLYQQGVLLCLCSRNTPENIEEAFQSLKLPLQQHHFVSARINPQNKAENIYAIAEELALSPDSFVFLDDSNYEIGLVRALLPQVECIQADYENADFLQEISAWFPHNIAQPLERTKLYREQKEREKVKQQTFSVEEYNRSLHTKCTCGPAESSQAERIGELSQRTNQCNLSAARYTGETLETLLTNQNYAVIALSASDRFGDMGLVGAAVLLLEEEQAVIEGFFLSCRVFGRGFELVLLEQIKEQAGSRSLSGIYNRNGKNKSYEQFYQENGVAVHEFL